MKNEKHPNKNRAVRLVGLGFTLVELIVVITILAILATIGFLALSGYSQDAKDSAIKTNVRSVYTAITAESAVTGNSRGTTSSTIPELRSPEASSYSTA